MLTLMALLLSSSVSPAATFETRVILTASEYSASMIEVSGEASLEYLFCVSSKNFEFETVHALSGCRPVGPVLPNTAEVHANLAAHLNVTLSEMSAELDDPARLRLWSVPNVATAGLGGGFYALVVPRGLISARARTLSGIGVAAASLGLMNLMERFDAPRKTQLATELRRLAELGPLTSDAPLTAGEGRISGEVFRDFGGALHRAILKTLRQK